MKLRGIVVVGLYLVSCSLAEGAGLLIYMQPPIGTVRSPETLSYRSMKKTGVKMTDVILADGTVREVENAGILAVFPEPPVVFDSANSAKVAEINEQAKIVSRYPELQQIVQSAVNKWTKAVDLAKASASKPKSISAQPPPKELVLGGVTYKGAVLSRVDGDIAIVFHEDGIAKIPIASLSQVQITALNATSPTERIAPDWAEKKLQREREISAAKEQQEQQLAILAAEKQRSLLIKAKQMEDAARFEDALSIYTETKSTRDMERVAGSLAAECEKKKDYELAAEYFEKAGLFSEAGRVRKTYNMVASIPSQRLSSEEIFAKCASATVVVIAVGKKGGGQGSGFFVHKSGYILTNQHVVDDAISIRVLVDGKEYSARLIDETGKPDLALLKIDLEEHSVLNFADSSRVKPGATVYAIGTPEGLPTSITGGIVSSTNRMKYGNAVFQISVLINHGNSGGPLIDEQGKVVGVTTFGEGTAGVVDGVHIGSDIQGINYAIKGNEAKVMLSKIPQL